MQDKTFIFEQMSSVMEKSIFHEGKNGRGKILQQHYLKYQPHQMVSRSV